MRADVEKCAELRKQGLTYQEIGEVVGLRDSTVRYALNNYSTGFRGISPARCIYPGLRDWLNDNECTVFDLVRQIYGEARTDAATRRYYRLLSGEYRLTIDDIDDILQLTGCTYEELFGIKGK